MYCSLKNINLLISTIPVIIIIIIIIIMNNNNNNNNNNLHGYWPACWSHICLTHPCRACGHPVDELGHHGLSCKFSKGRIPHHHMLNSIIHHSLASANVPSRLEPSNLYRADGKCPNGVTMVPWSNWRFLAWDATCVDTFCDSHKSTTAREAGGAVAHAETGKVKKYAHLDHAYLFQPVAFETCGTVGPESMLFLWHLSTLELNVVDLVIIT